MCLFLSRGEKYGLPQGGQQFFRGLNWVIFELYSLLGFTTNN